MCLTAYTAYIQCVLHQFMHPNMMIAFYAARQFVHSCSICDLLCYKQSSVRLSTACMILNLQTILCVLFAIVC